MEVLPTNVRGNLGYEVLFMTDEPSVAKKMFFTINGDLADYVNHPTGNKVQFIGDYIAVIHDILFKEKIDLDNGVITMGIINK